MSLINQMLKDLEQRNQPAGEIIPLGGEVRPVQTPQSPSIWPRVLLGMLLFGASLVAAWWKFQQPAAEPVEPIVAPVAAVSPPAPVVVASAPAQSETPPPPVVESAVEASPMLPRLPGLETELSTAPVEIAPVTLPEKRTEVPPAVKAVELAAAPPEEKSRSRRAAKQLPASPASSLKTVTPEQKSDNLYKQSVSMLQQGRVAEARDALSQSLAENPANHTARQLLVGLLVENKHTGEALNLLQEGVQIAPEQSGFVMALARLQVESGDRHAALQTLELGEKYATDDAEFNGFYAALLQRDSRHEEAVSRYLAALRGDPANTSWLVGVGISLQALDKNSDAREAFERARQTGQLSPELAIFVDQRLKQLKGK
jgi:MSHA biogenesis protein MshN